MIYKIGERPGKGIYRCLSSNWTVRLNEESDRLPPCGRCGRGQRVRYTVNWAERVVPLIVIAHTPQTARRGT